MSLKAATIVFVSNINSSTSMRWLLKGMGDGTLIGLLHVTPRTHLRVIKLLQTNLF